MRICAGIFGVGLALLPPSASAEMTSDQCIEANAKGQQLRREGKLRAAGEALHSCAVERCPALVRDDCTKRLSEVQSAESTLLFEVKDASGADVLGVGVTVDGAPLSTELDGSPLPVDPGKHLFTFTPPHRPAVTLTLIVTEGQKGRRERITIAAEAAPVAPETPKRHEERRVSENGPVETEHHAIGTTKTLGIVSAVAGLAGVSVGTAFGLMAGSAKRQGESDCGPGPTCADRTAALDQRSHELTFGAVSTVGFIAGGALLATGAVLLFLPSHKDEPKPVALGVLPAVGSKDASLFVFGEF